MPADTISLGAGVALVVAAVVWRWLVHRGDRQRIRTALHDPAPDRRCAALDALGERGIGANADLVLAVARVETDPIVLAALTRAVCRNQWEPADDASMVELRRCVLEMLERSDRPQADPAWIDPAWPDPASTDRAWHDAAWTDPAWTDLAWADPACADPAWAEPARADTACAVLLDEVAGILGEDIIEIRIFEHAGQARPTVLRARDRHAALGERSEVYA